MNKPIIQMTLYCIAIFAVLIVMAPAQSFAQITKASRLELTDSDKKHHIGPHLNETLDPDRQLTFQNILSRFNNLNRGDPLSSKISHFGVGASPRWLTLEVTNRTDQEDWILDLGGIFDGRYGKINAMSVYNYARNEMYLDAQTAQTMKATFMGSALAIKITPQKTELIVIFMTPAKSGPASFNFTLQTNKKWTAKTLKNGSLYTVVQSILLIISGCFVAFALIAKRPKYVINSLFFMLNAAFIYALQHTLFPASFLGAKFPILCLALAMLSALWNVRLFFKVANDDYMEHAALYILGGLLILATVLSMLPLKDFIGIQLIFFWIILMANIIGLVFVAFQKSSDEPRVTLFYVLSILAYGLGILISGIASGVVASTIAWALNAYIFMLVPHGGLLIAAIAEHIKYRQDEDVGEIAKKNRAAQSLARLQQSKDAADQARLLRVIERERELMADLREQEAERTEEMRKAKDAADAANAAKSAFLAVISHEIRTPMNGIMGIIKLLQDTNATEEQIDFILTMQKTGDTMVALLNDILDFEKIETGSMELEHINIDLHNMAKGIVTLMHGYVKGKNVELRSEVDPSVPRYVLGDPTRLRQVLLNLMSNAIKFTEEGSVTIRLTASPLASANDDYNITFSIVDTGIGIPEEAQKTLFEPFQQVDSSVARKYGGSGLGLAISMRLVEIMGSEIKLESAPGEGSNFYFPLRMEQGYGEDLAPIENPQDNAASQEDQPQSPVKPLSILAVEDNEINRKVLAAMLEKDNHDVMLAETGEEALEILGLHRFDLLLLDINLPGISGLDVAKEIRVMAEPYFKTLPIIALTGNVSQEDFDKIIEAGMNDLIPKPIDYDKMNAIIAGISVAPLEEIQPPLVTDPVSETLTVEEDDDVEINMDVCDQAILRNLYDVLGKEPVTELITDCFNKVEEILQMIDDAGEGATPEFLNARMHELKGMAYNFGLQSLGDIAKQGEQASKDGNAEIALECANQLKEEKAISQKTVDHWIDSQD